tara:strand:+ start:630 stop:1142 length:513 start_codon:yes stop_codon:yes gene_type:complete
MELKGNLVFLGMMGSGKSSLGLIVSKKLKKKFVDVDLEIEKKLNMKISKIFEDKGEKYFREIEEIITLNILKEQNLVVSLGGGAFLNKKIKSEILKNHVSFWLNWDIKTLVDRVKNSQKRPLAFNSTKQNLIKIIKKRSIIYSKAMYKINCDNLSKNQIAKDIMDFYENT